MLIFLDESFRKHNRTGQRFGELSGVAIPEDIFADAQVGMYNVRRPYHGIVLNEDDEIKGRYLLNSATLNNRAENRFSYKWNIAEEMIQYARRRRLVTFGIVCYWEQLHTFTCEDEHQIDLTYRYLFERIDVFMRERFPKRQAKLVFDDRGYQTNKKNARAITNFLSRHAIGRGYDTILRVPVTATSEGHNSGLQLADLITTVIGLRFQGEKRVQPLFRHVLAMLHRTSVGGQKLTGLKVMR